jgi:hypothetical protein
MGKNPQLLHDNSLLPSSICHARSQDCRRDTTKTSKSLKVLPNSLHARAARPNPFAPATLGPKLGLPLHAHTRLNIHDSIHIPAKEADNTAHGHRLSGVVEIPKTAIGPTARTRVMPSLPPSAELEHYRCKVHPAKTRQRRLFVHAEGISRGSSDGARPKNLHKQHVRHGCKTTLRNVRPFHVASRARCHHPSVRRAILQVRIIKTAIARVVAWRWELQLRQPPVLHPACTTCFTSQTALLHEGKEAVHVSRDNFASYVHAGPHSASTRQNLCTPHGFKHSCAECQRLMMHSVIENTLNGTTAQQKLRQSLLAELQPGPAKQTRSASLSRFATLLVPPQPSDQTRQPQQNLTDNDHVARRPWTSAQTTQHLHRRRRS